jgi:hypothetical protein
MSVLSVCSLSEYFPVARCASWDMDLFRTNTVFYKIILESYSFLITILIELNMDVYIYIFFSHCIMASAFVILIFIIVNDTSYLISLLYCLYVSLCVFFDRAIFNWPLGYC